MSTFVPLKDAQAPNAQQTLLKNAVVNMIQKSGSKALLISLEKLNKAKSKLSLKDLKRLDGSASIHSSRTNLQDMSQSQRQDDMESPEEFRKRIEQLPLPFEMLKAGLSELGFAPEGNKLVYRKLALPVRPTCLSIAARSHA